MNQLLRWAPAIIVSLIALYLSSLQGKTVDQAGLGKNDVQTLGHFVLYAVLFVCLYFAIESIILSAEISILYGMFLEFLQYFIPGRSPQLYDIIVNSLGVIITALFLWNIYLPLKRKQNK